MNTEKGVRRLHLLDLSPVGHLLAHLSFEDKKLVRIRLFLPKEKMPETFAPCRETRLLRKLLAGTPLEKLPLDYKLEGTRFQKHLWRTAQKIEPGTTLSYSGLSKMAGCKSPRAVGQALGRNPLPIIVPCHRVIGKDGSLTGFSSGLEVKRMLLEFERLKKNEDSHNE